MSTPRYLSADERRAMTVRTVLELAATTDPASITTATIAERMSLSQSAIFRHFPTKEAIWLATVHWVTDHLMERVDRAASTAPAPLAALEAVFLAHAAFAMENPGVPRLVFSEMQRAGHSPVVEVVQAMLTGYRQRLEALIEQGRTLGEVSAEVEPPSAATLFIGSIQGLVMQSMLANDMTRLERAAPAAFALFRRAIATAPRDTAPGAARPD
ncbi:MAG: TetR/AcrR family transcriptional regulator [Pseudomonadota bacterium]